MSFGQVLDIAASGMSAEAIRLNTISSNLSNANTASSDPKNVYQTKYPVFKTVYESAQGQLNHQPAGVMVEKVLESETPARKQYEPHHPLANKDGYVFYPKVNVVGQMADMISASRAYQNQIEVMNTAKSLMQRTLTLGE